MGATFGERQVFDAALAQRERDHQKIDAARADREQSKQRGKQRAAEHA